MKIYNMPRGTGKTRYLTNLNMPIVVATKAMKNEAELYVYTVKEFLKLEKKPAVVCVDELDLVLGRLLDCYVLLQRGDNFGSVNWN